MSHMVVDLCSPQMMLKRCDFWSFVAENLTGTACLIVLICRLSWECATGTVSKAAEAGGLRSRVCFDRLKQAV